MASPPFEVEDQTDEDFFDKLVNDEIDVIGSVPPSLVKSNEFDEAAAFSNLSISELGSALDAHVDSESIGFGINSDSGNKDGVVSAPLDAQVDSVVAKESDSSIPSDANETDKVGIGSGGALGKNMETEAKEVQWDSFNSDSKLHGGSKYGSYSDLFNELGDNSEDPFANVGGIGKSETPSTVTSGFIKNQVADLGLSTFEHHGEGQFYGTAQEQNTEGVQDLSSSQYWENLYPGWKYDPNTGQWYQLEGYDANANVNGGVDTSANANALESLNMNAQLVDNANVSDQRTDAYYLQQTAQSVAGSVIDTGTTSSVSNWNHISQGNSEYPAHMVFDPQYPGWYYDTITQEWKQLDSYTGGVDQSITFDHNQQHYNLNAENYGSQGQFSQDSVANSGASVSSYNQQNVNMWQPQQVAESHKLGNQHVSTDPGSNSMNQQTGFDPSGSIVLSEQASQSTEVAGFPSSNPVGHFGEHYNQTRKEQNQNIHFSPAQFDSQKSVYFSQQPLQSGTSFSYVPSEGRSSAGRPSHALVTFGFGGKLIVMKDNNFSHSNSTYASQDSAKGVINVLNMMEVFMDKTNASSFGTGGCDYFDVLCQQSFPGPLVGGNAGSKELNKWIDDRIANCETPYMDFRRGDLLRLLFSLLKISFQYYGKLRSPTDEPLKESDNPESAVAKLFASAKRNQEYGALRRCLQNMPSEAQIQATTLEVQKLLVSGRKKEAFEYAKEGQLWGPALVLASQLGDKFYGDTVKQMALKQFIPGSPLRTLCLLIAGQPADVFCNATSNSSLPGSFNISQQPAEQVVANHMLHEWEENLAIITANRTKDDELVIIHLGDSLWKEMGEITAAHICYLVAEANFEPYSDSARMCLVGADHWKFPRTYASPEAIQRTELYEYSKVLGNSQFLLLPFQPYKLIYAHMLAEVGKVADALKYCQAILKSLKAGRSHEVETCKQLVLSLEERIRTHLQGGYSTNLAPNKLVGKLLTFIDSTAHRVVGGLPPPAPMTSPGSAQHNEHAHPLGGPKVTNSQSTMAMSSLMPSASMEPISEWTGAESNRLSVPNRSISEPDFGRNPVKADSSKEANSSKTPGKPPASSGSSRFGRFGSQLFQKTVGLVIRSRPDQQAKLGEANKFYFDEKLKRWVEEGAEPPPEEAALPPPPKTAAFQSGNQDYSIQDVLKPERFDRAAGPETKSPTSSEQSSGIPPIPPSSNQFTARGRMGVRSRYVDTFNKGGGMPTNLFPSPSIPAAKPGGVSTPKFFIPSPAASGTETLQTVEENMKEGAITDDNHPKPFQQDSFSSPPPSTSSTMHRFPSVDNIIQKGGVMAKGHSYLPAHSRRTASWSGSLNDASSNSMKNEIKPLGEALGMPPSLYMPRDPPSMEIPRTGSGSRDDLHEVQL